MLDTAEETLAKIRNISRLPTSKEVKQLLIGNRQSQWFRFCSQNGIYSAYTTEFLDLLSDEIRWLNISPKVELFAGDGKLTYHLRKRGIDIMATDGYFDVGIRRDRNLVQELSHEDALRRLKPKIVCFVDTYGKVQI